MRRLALIVTCCASAAPLQAQTFFQYISEPGDHVGLGQSALITPGQATFIPWVTSSWAEVRVVLPTTTWTLSFNDPAHTPPEPGTYDPATRWPFNARGVAGLSVTGNSSGCNMLTGRFVVSELVIQGGQLVSFAADFEQHCEGFLPALIGAIRFNSAAPTLLARLWNSLNTPESFTFLSQPGAVGGGQSGTLTNLTNGPFDTLQIPSIGGVYVTIHASPTQWELGFENGLTVPLAPGAYPGAQDVNTNPPGVPGIRVRGPGPFCSTGTGDFTVEQAQYDAAGVLRKLALDFEHRCQGSSATLYGSLRLNSLIPPAVLELLGLGFASTFCSGESCPCGNDDPFGGCRGAHGSGASLTVGSGGPSLAADDLELLGLGLPPGAPAVLYAGRELERSAFGNGVSCLAGDAARVALGEVDRAGAARWSHLSGVARALGTAAGPGPASALRFQVVYRDQAGACGQGWNASNGVQVRFGP